MTGVALVTGGSRGIGRATSVLLGELGWAVGVGYVSDERAATDACAEVTAAGGRAAPLRLDVSVEADVLGAFDDLESSFGPVTALVNNAGIGAETLPLADMSVERLKRTFDVNVLGAFLCAREAARRMSTDRGGSGGAIVNVTSAAARIGSPNEWVDYAASKGALDTMTLGLAKELGPAGIRVNSVRPGAIDTDFHASVGQPGRAQRIGAGTPLGREGRPDEVAAAIVWLLTDAASYTTGALVDVSGGR